MLEICFNSSVEVDLKIAQNCGERSSSGNLFPGLIYYKSNPSIFEKIWRKINKRRIMKQYQKKQDELEKQAVSLGGLHKDVLALIFSLFEGDILSPITFESCPEKDKMISIAKFFGDDEEWTQELWEKTFHNLERLKQCTDSVRIWVDNLPETQCGLLFVADLLVDKDVEIHIVQVPDEYRGWREIPHQLYGTFQNRQTQLSREEIKDLSSKWKKLKLENAPLRVIENNQVISADEDYYDNRIRALFPKESCTIGQLIVNAMDVQHIFTGDVFIVKRIKNFIKNGELEVIDDTPDELYGYTVAMVKN